MNQPQKRNDKIYNEENEREPNTRSYVHWLADVQFGGFAPAFTLSFHDSECSRIPIAIEDAGCP